MKRWTLFFAVALLGVFAQGCAREVHIAAAQWVDFSQWRQWWWLESMALAFLFFFVLGHRKNQKGGESSLQRICLGAAFFLAIVGVQVCLDQFVATPRYMAEAGSFWQSTTRVVDTADVPAEDHDLSAEDDTTYVVEGVTYGNVDDIPAGYGQPTMVIRTRPVVVDDSTSHLLPDSTRAVFGKAQNKAKAAAFGSWGWIKHHWFFLATIFGTLVSYRIRKRFGRRSGLWRWVGLLTLSVGIVQDLVPGIHIPGLNFFMVEIMTILSYYWLQRMRRPIDLTPKESEESVIPYAHDPSSGESKEEYERRRARSIAILKEENSRYKQYVHKPGVVSLVIMTVIMDIFAFINGIMVLAFFLWLIWLGLVIWNWVRQPERWPSLHHARSLVGVFLGLLVLAMIINLFVFGWKMMLMTLVLMPVLIVLMAAAYIVGGIYITPIRRRWIFTVFGRPIATRRFILYTADHDTIRDDLLSMHSGSVRDELRRQLDELDISGRDWMDNGLNITLLSSVLFPIFGIMNQYFMVVEATYKTRLLPTASTGLEQHGIHIVTKTAGTLSLFYRWFQVLGVDPIKVARMSTSDREEITMLTGRVIEGHLAERLKTLDYDKAMSYPFFDEEGGTTGDSEYVRLLIELNREQLVLFGSYTVKFGVIDRDPSEVIQKAMDELTKLVYEMDQTALKEKIRAGLGRAAAAEIINMYEAMAQSLAGGSDSKPSAEQRMLAMERAIALKLIESGQLKAALVPSTSASWLGHVLNMGGGAPLLPSKAA